MPGLQKPFGNGRGGEIRTHDLLYPKQARYQPTLRPDKHTDSQDVMRASKGKLFIHRLQELFVAVPAPGRVPKNRSNFSPPSGRVLRLHSHATEGGNSGQPINLATARRLLKLYDRFFN